MTNKQSRDRFACGQSRSHQQIGLSRLDGKARLNSTIGLPAISARRAASLGCLKMKFVAEDLKPSRLQLIAISTSADS